MLPLSKWAVSVLLGANGKIKLTAWTDTIKYMGVYCKVRKRIVVGMLVIALAAALLGGASYAWFIADDNVAGTIETGTLAISAETVEGMDFSLDNLAPGGETDVWAVEFVNEGSLDLYYRAKIEGSWDDEELELEKILVRWSDDENIASEYMEIDGDWFIDEGILIADGGSETYYFQFLFKEDAGNDYQSKTFTATINVEATQKDHQDVENIKWNN